MMAEDASPEGEAAPVLRFPDQSRPGPEDRPFLSPVPFSACRHHASSFTVDTAAGVCRCCECGGEVSAMFVLERLMQAESRWQAARRTYGDQMQRLAARSRVTCRQCGCVNHLR